MKIQFIVLKIYSSIFKRIHSWGLLSLLLLIYLTSVSIKSPMMVRLFGRIGLMSLHVFCGFILGLFFIIIAYNFLLTTFFKNKKGGEESKTAPTPGIDYQESGKRLLVDCIFYTFIFLICLLGILYYAMRAFSLETFFISQAAVSLLHVIVGWFFMSIVLIKYYLTMVRWFHDVSHYLRED